MLPVSALFEFANLTTKRTGIGTAIWVEAPVEIKSQHDLRLKVVPNNNKIISDEMCDVIFNRAGKITEIKPNKVGKVIIGKNKKNLQKWIYLNINLLIDLWDGKIEHADFFEKYKSLKETKTV
jgi:hypothetical protein